LKKSIAIAGTSLLGLAAAVGSSSSAQADLPDVTTPCTTYGDHQIGTGGPNWYMDCIPQFGLGKAEFSIKADAHDGGIDFPAGFKDLSDPGVTATSNIDSAIPDAGDYFETTSPTHGILELTKDAGASTSHTQVYDGSMIYKLAGVTNIDTADLPAACFPADPAYVSAWKVSYLPTTVTFTQTIHGKVWTYTVTSAPPPLYLALPFDVETGPAQDGSACAASGTYSIQTSTTSSQEFEQILFPHATSTLGGDAVSTLSPFPRFDDNDRSLNSRGSLGAFSPRTTAIPAADPPRPELAATGTDPSGAMLAAGAFLLAGALAFFARRRRRSS
jgi:LPXTG-motif cell wall-anchored protein